MQLNQHQKPLNCRRNLLRLKIQNFQVQKKIREISCLFTKIHDFLRFFLVESLKCPKKLAMTISRKIIPLDDQLEQDLLQAAQVSTVWKLRNFFLTSEKKIRETTVYFVTRY